jgi:hypothetical protein
MDCIRIHPMIPPLASTAVLWEQPKSIMFSLSSIRDEPLPKRPKPSAFHLYHKSVTPPQSSFSSISPAPITRPADSNSPKRPIYASSDPQVVDVLDECSNTFSDLGPLLSKRPRWVLVAAALSTYYHPSHPAHLAFWRPDMMNETGEMIDKFLSESHILFILVTIYSLRSYTQKLKKANFLNRDMVGSTRRFPSIP